MSDADSQVGGTDDEFARKPQPDRASSESGQDEKSKEQAPTSDRGSEVL